jgi:Sensors of blue-light using FAD
MTDPSGRTAEPPVPGRTFRLIYRSRSLIPAPQRRVVLGEIFSVARPNNKRQQITGALLLTDDWFVQALEGEETAVRGLLAHIEQDPRHDSVRLLEAGDVPARVFSRWAMAKVAEDGEPDIQLIANTRGAAVAADRGTTSEQERVLDVMRDAARCDAHVR